MSSTIGEVPLRDAARQRYLNYALSVISSRALPDVRDGQKPVQRRILYAMFQDLRLLPDKKELKCAKVVGEVLGNYHPHGDTAVYDALVRMAQEWVLRAPLIDGHGNFGSVDGDSAAAYRYTEAKLRPFAIRLLDEINQDTVDFRDTFDGSRREPIVLPAQAPVLLVNGATGIAVGIATNIPPHNLREVCTAASHLIDNPEATVAELCRQVKGPDFPTGGQILNSKRELRQIYESGSGPVKIRGEYELEEKGRRRQIIITSIPYMVKKQELAAKIRELALDKKIPQIVDVRDESTTDTRLVLEIRADAEVEKVMAYLYKATDLQINFNVNLTCLVPIDEQGTLAPRNVDLVTMLRHFLDFRHQVVRRRFEFELRELRARIHILDGFAKIFNGLDDAIRIIREAKDKKDAGEKLMAHFKLDEIQTQAILEMMLYRIASLEIKKILQERKEKKERAEEIETILASKTRVWKIIKDELDGLAAAHGEKRRSRISELSEDEQVEVSAEDFIVEEDQFVILTTGGWIKRIGSIKSLDKVSLRAGDAVAAVVAGGTKSTVALFTNMGVAYTARILDLPASRGHGDPIQKLFKFKDKERVIAMFSMDPRVAGRIQTEKAGKPPRIHALAVTSQGFGMRFSFESFVEPSTRVGRKFARLPDDAEVVGCFVTDGSENCICVTRDAHAILCPVSEINFLEGPGKGVYVIKVDAGDIVLGAAVSADDSKGLTAVTGGGAQHNINARRYRITSRGGRGFQIIKRGMIESIVAPEIVLPELGPAN